MGNDEIKNTKEAAAYVRLSQSTMNQARTHGTGPKYIKMGHRVFYRTSDLDAWMASRTIQSTSQKMPYIYPKHRAA